MAEQKNIALITGVTGQDGSYLSELLLSKGYEVHGIIRRSSVDYRERIAHLEGQPHFHLHYADLGDSMSIVGVVGKVRPTEIYNLAAQSHVQVSFDSPEYTADVDAVGVLRILEAVRTCGLASTCRIYQASTSELYGKVEEVPQNENTPFHPYSPYAVAKLYGFWIMKEYRDAYGMFACNGILFNHESERRGETFVTRKITLAAARIKQGKQDKLYLGNLSSLRDWGYARDYVECMWLILQNDKPEDFVIATGQQHSVREFATLAFRHVGIELEWQGEGADEKGIDRATGKVLVEVSPDFYRPTDVVNLWGDPTKAKARLGWNPNATTFEELVKLMVDHDMKKVAGDDAAAHRIEDVCSSFEQLVARVDAVYIATPHLLHYQQAKYAIGQHRHVLCETPLVLQGGQARELYKLAEDNGVILMEANKTAHCPAFNHLITMIKSGLIGEVVDIDASESKVWGDPSLRELDPRQAGGSFYEMGSYPLLPIIRLLGTEYENLNLYSRMRNQVDVYTKGVMRYKNAVASFKLGLGVKTEGNLVISGTKGYAYVPAPWWKTDYYELRYEDQNQNKKYFYTWDGEGLRYEIQEFISCIVNHRFSTARLRRRESIAMAEIMEQFTERKNFIEL